MIPISIFGFIANSLSLLCLWKTNYARNTAIKNSDRILLVLVLCDIVTSLVILPAKAILYISTTLTSKPKAELFLDGVNFSWTNLLILAIALNRYIVIKYPFRHHNIMTNRRTNFLILSAVIPGPFLAIRAFYLDFRHIIGSGMVLTSLIYVGIITFYIDCQSRSAV